MDVAKGLVLIRHCTLNLKISFMHIIYIIINIKVGVNGNLNTISNLQDIADAFISHHMKIAEKSTEGRHDGIKAYYSF